MLDAGNGGGGATNTVAQQAAAERARLAALEAQRAEAARKAAEAENKFRDQPIDPVYTDKAGVINKDTFVSQAQIAGKTKEELGALYDQFDKDGTAGLSDAEFDALYADAVGETQGSGAAEEPAEPETTPYVGAGKGDKDGNYLKPLGPDEKPGPVRQLQQDLGQLKDKDGKPYFQYEHPATGGATGGFFEVTETAVKKFQTDHGLPATGEVDQATYDAIQAELKAQRQPEETDPTGGETDPTSGETDPTGGGTGSGGALTPEQKKAQEAIDKTMGYGLPKPGSAHNDHEARRALNANVTTMRDNLKKLEGTPDYDAYKAKVDEYAKAVTEAGKPAPGAEAPTMSDDAKKGEELVKAAEADPFVASQWTPEQQVQVQRYAEHQAKLAQSAYDKGDLAGVEAAKANLERTINATYNAPSVQSVAVNIAAEADLDAKIQDLKIKAGDDEAVKEALGDADKNDPASYKRVADMLSADDPRKKVLELMADPATTPGVRDELRKALEDDSNTTNDIEDAVRNAKTPADAKAIAAAMRAKNGDQWAVQAKVMDALANDKISEQVRTKLQHAIQDGHGTYGDLSEAFKHASSPEDFKAIAVAAGLSDELAPFKDAEAYGKASPELRQEIYNALKDNWGTRGDLERMLGKAETAEDFEAIAAVAAAKGSDFGDLKVLAQTRAADLREAQEEEEEEEPVPAGGGGSAPRVV